MSFFFFSNTFLAYKFPERIVKYVLNTNPIRFTRIGQKLVLSGLGHLFWFKYLFFISNIKVFDLTARLKANHIQAI